MKNDYTFTVYVLLSSVIITADRILSLQLVSIQLSYNKVSVQSVHYSFPV